MTAARAGGRVAVAMILALVCGCIPGQDPDSGVAEPALPAHLVSINVTPDPAVVGLGERITLTAIGAYSDGSSAPVELLWQGWGDGTVTGLLGGASLDEDGTAIVGGAALTLYGSGEGVETITVVSRPWDPPFQTAISVTVAAQPAPLPTITTLGPGIGGAPPFVWVQPFFFQLTYMNGSGPATWEILPHPGLPPSLPPDLHQGLPPWIILDPATGLLSEPQPPATLNNPGVFWPDRYFFRVRVTDAAGSDVQDLVLHQWRRL